MLVLNTNEQWSSWQVLSNSMIRTYPDFKSLLFFPYNRISFGYPSLSINNWETNYYYDTTKSAFNVNWTVVNIANQVLDEAIMLNWTTAWTDLWSIINPAISSWRMNFYKNKISDDSFDWRWIFWFRLWFSEAFQESWTVWKKVVSNLWFCISNNNNSYWTGSSTLNFSIVLRLWLLHSDWTITYWERLRNDALKSPNWTRSDNTLRYWGSATRHVEFTSNWLEYVSWDRLIIDAWVEAHVQRASWASWSTYNVYIASLSAHLYFWKRWSVDNNTYDISDWTTTDIEWSSYLWTSNFRWRPIQISIE